MDTIDDNKITVAIIDDDVAVLDNISIILSDFGRLSFNGAYRTCREAVRAFSHNPFQVLLLDLSLKEENGIDYIPGLLACSSTLKIIIYSNVYSQDNCALAKAAGAKGYITKNVRGELLYNAILAVHDGREVWPEEKFSGVQTRSKVKYRWLLKLFGRLHSP